jgi:hypothetical protein
MRPLLLDYQRCAEPQAGAWLLLGVGVVLSVAAVLILADLKRELTVWEEQAARSNHGVRSNMSMRASEATQRELKQANIVLQQLALPWEELFAALEATRDEKVALLVVEPDAAKGQVRIGAEAKSAAHMLNYLRRLESDTALGEVVLLNHQVQLQDAERPLRFSVVASWGSKP